LDEDYRYSTINEMIEKIRISIGYNALRDRLVNHIDSINIIIEEKNNESTERARNTLTCFLGMISVIAGIAAIDNWVKLLQRIGFECAIIHPLRLTLFLWILLCLVALIICYRLIHKKDIKMSFSSLILKNSSKLVKNRKANRILIYKNKK
jgi:hypothetical protein